MESVLILGFFVGNLLGILLGLAYQIIITRRSIRMAPVVELQRVLRLTLWRKRA